jgi:thiosulfate/3-mercaptopyruvate sulfurtransferase
MLRGWSMNFRTPFAKRIFSLLVLVIQLIPGMHLFSVYALEVPTPKASANLVSVQWLKDHLNDKALVLVDTRAEADYQQGHIPGAVWMDAAALSATTSEDGIRALQESLAERFSPLGIQGQEMVIFYEDGIGVRAPRALWYILYAGHAQAGVLDGGLKSWKQALCPLSTAIISRPARPLAVKENSDVIATFDYVAQRLNAPGMVILDVRSREEFAGTAAGDSPRKGHIPGALSLEWTQLLEDNLHYFTPSVLQRKLEKAGVTPDKEVIVYCQRGNRASNTFLALRSLGFTRLRNYVGSWYEWASLPELPISKDNPPPAR